MIEGLAHAGGKLTQCYVSVISQYIQKDEPSKMTAQPGPVKCPSLAQEESTMSPGSVLRCLPLTGHVPALLMLCEAMRLMTATKANMHWMFSVCRHCVDVSRLYFRLFPQPSRCTYCHHLLSQMKKLAHVSLAGSCWSCSWILSRSNIMPGCLLLTDFPLRVQLPWAGCVTHVISFNPHSNRAE